MTDILLKKIEENADSVFNEKDACRNYVYILQCRDNSLYTGWTNDIGKRLAGEVYPGKRTGASGTSGGFFLQRRSDETRGCDQAIVRSEEKRTHRRETCKVLHRYGENRPGQRKSNGI